MHPEFPFVAFLAAVLVLIPLPWHWRAGNVATLAITAWLFVVNIIYGVDAIVWGNNVNIVIPVWCDITTKILIGSNISLAAANMCVCIHLEQVSSGRLVMITRSHKRRRQIFEAIMCYLVPVVWMALHYIVQGHRFDIIEGYGCRPTTHVSIPAIFLIWFPSLLMSVIASVFAALAFAHFLRRRVTFAKLLENSQTGLSTSRYLRLMAMAVVEMIIGVASTSATLAFSVKWDMRPWTNWADVHWNFSRIDLYATLFTPPFVLRFYYGIWWIVPISSFIFFLFFAFGQEAMKEYGACATWFRTHILRRRDSKNSISRLIPLPASRLTVSTASTCTVSTFKLPSYSQPSTPLDKIEDKYAILTSPSSFGVAADRHREVIRHADDIPLHCSSSASSPPPV
ncbi:hypothetical protein AcW1_002108 [Taiwanofungus camphoratus]|nr:hypothetical protein AcW1_002108 [Antrodia cinnamomea]